MNYSRVSFLECRKAIQTLQSGFLRFLFEIFDCLQLTAKNISEQDFPINDCVILELFQIITKQIWVNFSQLQIIQTIFSPSSFHHRSDICVRF
jgi:hypothetical protein